MNFGRDIGYLDSFSCFPQSLQMNSGTAARLNQESFLSNLSLNVVLPPDVILILRASLNNQAINISRAAITVLIFLILD
jgi:hypothetical protein